MVESNVTRRTIIGGFATGVGFAAVNSKSLIDAAHAQNRDDQGLLQRKGWNMAKKGKGIFLVYVDIDAQHDKEFNDWYNTEHLPELLAVPGILSAARYKAVKVPNIWPSMSWRTSACWVPRPSPAGHARRGDSGSLRA